MNNKKRFITACWLFVCSSLLLFGGVRQEPQDADSLKTDGASFIRMDLLSAEKRPMPRSVRNIFTVGRSSAAEDISPEAFEEKRQEMRNSQNPRSQEENSVITLNLRYLGYVFSRQKIVGLIVFEGEALAVVQGESLTEGFTVGRISPEEIEILGLDSKPMMFAIEGEFP